MLKCTINGVCVEVEEGTTIIQAFKKLEKDIAHYCWHPGLSIAGVCRLCMVEIEGQAKLQIACNTKVQEGMVITNQSEKVQEAVRWGLEFHLINHPLDCPICDQAGECILQEQYMKFGNYDPLMAERKVKKRKVVDLGSKIVLDTERCILCSRCTRFTDEITKTKELGIFKRGDRSEIGIFKDQPLENDYALNTVDICPVGALTSKKFRFKQRVWYLKTAPSVCTGCSTGCHINVFYNEEGVWRLQPRLNPEINQHWMCDKGREFKHVQPKNRLKKSVCYTSSQERKFKTKEALSLLHQKLQTKKQVGVVLTGQYTCEEYEDFLTYANKHLKQKSVFHWKNNPESFNSFDGFLIRGDKNPNTKGLLKEAQNQNLKIQEWEDFEKTLPSFDALIVCGPENPFLFPSLEEKLKLFLKCPLLIWFSPHTHDFFKRTQGEVWTLPTRTYFEKSGTFINSSGKEQKIKAIGTLVKEALSLSQMAKGLQGQSIENLNLIQIRSQMKNNHFLDIKGQL